jgi:hypothetical protein
MQEGYCVIRPPQSKVCTALSVLQPVLSRLPERICRTIHFRNHMVVGLNLESILSIDGSRELEDGYRLD